MAMNRSMRRLWELALSCVVMASVLSACATGEVCREEAITGMKRCQPASGDYGEAAGTAVAAGTAWGVVGCTVNGCEPPFRCNKDKQCERIRCGEGGDPCPPGYACDLEQLVCK